MQGKRLDAAQSYFTQARDTWKQLFGDQYPSVAVAYSNLGSVCLEKKDLPCAEKMYRDAVSRLDASSANSLNDTVAHLKLGRALLREGRFADAEHESLFGYNGLVKRVGPNDRFLKVARTDLAAIYDDLHDAAKAARFRSELEAATQTAKK
jgi:eukaryotic-like serine/threonine-protein kinase